MGVVDDEALRCGLNKDKSRAADRAASTDEAEKRELVWKNGSESKFLFCSSETEGTTWERRSCLLFRVTKAAFEVMQEATLPQALEKDFCNWEITGSSLGRSFFSWRERINATTDQVRKLWDSRPDLSDHSTATASLSDIGTWRLSGTLFRNKSKTSGLAFNSFP